MNTQTRSRRGGVRASALAVAGLTALAATVSANAAAGGNDAFTLTEDARAHGIDGGFVQTVTNTNASGAGSLRAAINAANDHGSGLISFSLGADCGPHVISLDSPLPDIAVPLYINGFTQGDAAQNDLDVGDDAKLCVILEASGGTANGLHVPSGAPDTATLTVRGIAFGGFATAAINLEAGVGHFVEGDRFGGTASGHALSANSLGVRVGVGTHGVTIGGDEPAQRNVIVGGSGSGIALFGNAPTGSPPVIVGTYANAILRNLIGVDWDKDAGVFVPAGNGTRGIYISAHDNVVAGNFIGENAQAGILLTGGGALANVIESNDIGFPWGNGIFGNGQAGIHLGGSTGDAPANNSIHYNVIAANGTQGVWVEIGRGNAIYQNGIYSNGELGIDLGATGVLPNDNDGAAQPPDSANRGLNYPVLESAIGNSAHGVFTGSLSSTAGSYRIDFYETPNGCDENGDREGFAYIGNTTVSITKTPVGGDGVASFSVSEGPGDIGQLYAGAGITATATDQAGNTSEFSACTGYAIPDRIFRDGFEPAGL